jgi:hypothetical protein
MEHYFLSFVITYLISSLAHTLFNHMFTCVQKCDWLHFDLLGLSFLLIVHDKDRTKVVRWYEGSSAFWTDPCKRTWAATTAKAEARPIKTQRTSQRLVCTGLPGKKPKVLSAHTQKIPRHNLASAIRYLTCDEIQTIVAAQGRRFRRPKHSTNAHILLG